MIASQDWRVLQRLGGLTTVLTTLELPPEAYHSEHYAARFPYLLASAIAHWVGTWLQPGHCVPSAGSWPARMIEGFRERLM